MKTLFNKKQAIIPLIPFALLLNSCSSDFPSVKKFGMMSKSLQEASSNIANDIYGSCIRRTQYISFLNIKNNPIAEREKEKENCDIKNKPVVNKVIQANAVLINYMVALNKIASGDTVTFDRSFRNLEESLNNLKIPIASSDSGEKAENTVQLAPSVVKTGVIISNFLANAFGRKYRRETLKQVIVCSDQYIQKYIKGDANSPQISSLPNTNKVGLTSLVEDGYQPILKAEELKIRGYFISYLAALAPNKKTSSSERVNLDEINREREVKPIFEFLELEEKYNKATEVINDKKTTADVYVKILNNIADMHKELKEEFQGKGKNKISDLEQENLCSKQKIKEENKTENNEKNTAQNIKELNNANTIVSKYTKRLEPLIEKLK